MAYIAGFDGSTEISTPFGGLISFIRRFGGFGNASVESGDGFGAFISSIRRFDARSLAAAVCKLLSENFQGNGFMQGVSSREIPGLANFAAL
jgi:hypothetical protein